MRGVIPLIFICLLIISGCTSHEERIINAQHQCTDYGQNYIVAIEESNETEIYCYQTSPCKVIRKVIS